MKGLQVNIRRLLFWLWPPYEAKIAKDYILERQKQIVYSKIHEQIELKVRDRVSQLGGEKDLLSVAQEIRESEMKRKETIENKATMFVYAVGFSLTILSLILAVLGGGWGIDGVTALIVAVLYFSSFIFLLGAAYYSVKVRKVEAFHSLCPDMFLSVLEKKENWIEGYIIELVTNSKLNEDRLTIMANDLSVAEKFFLRGLVILTIASTIGVLVKVCW
jgi:hypothetical protein